MEPDQAVRLCFHYHNALDHDDDDSGLETDFDNLSLGRPYINGLPPNEKIIFIHSNLVGRSTYSHDI
jgi:hypothetical protein